MYYLDKATENKTQLEALHFDAHQLNFMLKMMLQCRKLRQREPIINLMRHSLPDTKDLELVKKQGHDGSEYLEPTIIDKVVA